MDLVLVRGMAGRLELKCRMRDVEVTDEALLQPIQDLRGVAAGKAMVVQHDVR